MTAINSMNFTASSSRCIGAAAISSARISPLLDAAVVWAVSLFVCVLRLCG